MAAWRDARRNNNYLHEWRRAARRYTINYYDALSLSLSLFSRPFNPSSSREPTNARSVHSYTRASPDTSSQNVNIGNSNCQLLVHKMQLSHVQATTQWMHASGKNAPRPFYGARRRRNLFFNSAESDSLALARRLAARAFCTYGCYIDVWGVGIYVFKFMDWMWNTKQNAHAARCWFHSYASRCLC